MPKPLVSVITPAYNSGRFIEATILSVLNQTFSDWELVIADDKSTDDTCRIVQGYARQDARVRLEIAERNRGPGPTRNRAIQLARGRYLAFLDSDDLWDAEKLERQLAFMRTEGHAFSFTGYRVISEAGEMIGEIPYIPERMRYEDLLKRTAIGCLTVMLDRERTGRVEFPALRRNQDFALWLSILKRGITARSLPSSLASYRIVSTSNTSSKLRSARSVWSVYRDLERLSLPRAAWYFLHYAWNAASKHRKAGVHS
jgi:teichuronic acid biosynthesis glycosyltransferase TuaG